MKTSIGKLLAASAIAVVLASFVMAPVAAAAVVGTTVAVTAAAVGSMVATVPPNCAPASYGGMVYQQCGSTWYAPQGSQYTVVNPPY